MIVGGYSLDLYCDNEAEHKNELMQWHVGNFGGRTQAQCAKFARQAGWKIDWKNRRAYCPRCNQKKLNIGNVLAQ